MAKELINTGTVTNDGTGDTIRDAMVKVNNNINEIYSVLGNNVNLDPHLQIGDVLVPSAGYNIPFYAANGLLSPTPGFEYDLDGNRIRYTRTTKPIDDELPTFTITDYNNCQLSLIEYSDIADNHPGIYLIKRRGSLGDGLIANIGDILGAYGISGGLNSIQNPTYNLGELNWVSTSSTTPNKVNSVVSLQTRVNDQLITILQSDNTGNAVFNGIKFLDNTVQTSSAISLNELKSIVADSTDFADFQLRIAAL